MLWEALTVGSNLKDSHTLFPLGSSTFWIVYFLSTPLWMHPFDLKTGWHIHLVDHLCRSGIRFHTRCLRHCRFWLIPIVALVLVVVAPVLAVVFATNVVVSCRLISLQIVWFWLIFYRRNCLNRLYCVAWTYSCVLIIWFTTEDDSLFCFSFCSSFCLSLATLFLTSSLVSSWTPSWFTLILRGLPLE